MNPLNSVAGAITTGFIAAALVIIIVVGLGGSAPAFYDIHFYLPRLSRLNAAGLNLCSAQLAPFLQGLDELPLLGARHRSPGGDLGKIA